MWMYVYFLLIIQCNGRGRKGSVEEPNSKGVEGDGRRLDKGIRRGKEGANGRNGNSNMPIQSQGWKNHGDQ